MSCAKKFRHTHCHLAYRTFNTARRNQVYTTLIQEKQLRNSSCAIYYKHGSSDNFTAGVTIEQNR